VIFVLPRTFARQVLCNRASKAALNQPARTATVERRRSNPVSLCVVLNPGIVNTLFTRNFAKTKWEVQTPQVAAGDG
jgi:hypothetical protein